mmetsp:Transcript_60167/g.141645  ORF Transcript_60167/g.141645 Transcript_60167/m.141645 type:complete len:290 (-) Transcript_60167:262-1131(-)
MLGSKYGPQAVLFLVVALGVCSTATGHSAPLDMNVPKQPLRLRGGEQANDHNVFAWVTPLFPDVATMVPSSFYSLFEPLQITPTVGAGTGAARGAKPLPARNARASSKTVVASKAEKVEVDTVEQTIEVDATPEEVFAVATNFEDYPKWAGGCQSAKILKQGADAPELVVFDMGIFGLSMKNTMQYIYEKPNKMTWWVTEGGVKDLLGIYEFKALPNGRTHVTYKLRVDPGFAVPKVMRNTASRTIASSALKELKRHTEKLKMAQAKADGLQVEVESPTAALRSLIALC